MSHGKPAGNEQSQLMPEAGSAYGSASSAYAFLLITVAVEGIGSGIILPVIPQLLVELTGEPVPQAAIYGGYLMALFALVQFFAAPVLGNLSDRYGRRPILLGSLAGFGLTWVVIGLSSSLGWLFMGAILAGAFGATLSTANAYVADVTPQEERAGKFGMMTAAFGAGAVIGPMLAGVLERYGTRMPFFVAAGLALCNVIYGLLVLPESLRPENRRPFLIARANPLGTFVQIRRQLLLVRLLAAWGLMQITILTEKVTWGYFTMLKFGWSQGAIGLSLSLASGGMVIVQAALLGPVVRRLGEVRTACLGFIFAITGLLGYALAPRGWIFVAFILPSALGSLTGAALISYMSKHTAADAQGEFQGAVVSIASAIAAITPILATHLFHRFSTNDAVIYFPGTPYLIAALLACVGLALTVHSNVRRT
jgi:MFS transporter, DHA1 family, tetracycline resistance protein